MILHCELLWIWWNDWRIYIGWECYTFYAYNWMAWETKTGRPVSSVNQPQWLKRPVILISSMYQSMLTNQIYHVSWNIIKTKINILFIQSLYSVRGMNKMQTVYHLISLVWIFDKLSHSTWRIQDHYKQSRRLKRQSNLRLHNGSANWLMQHATMRRLNKN